MSAGGECLGRDSSSPPLGDRATRGAAQRDADDRSRSPAVERVERAARRRATRGERRRGDETRRDRGENSGADCVERSTTRVDANGRRRASTRGGAR